MATLRQSRRKTGSRNLWPVLLAVALLALAAGTGALYWSHREHEVDAATQCLLRGDPPVASLFMVDLTDQLSSANIDMIATTIADQVKALPRASRVIIVPFGDETASALTPLDLPCTVPRGDAARLDENSRYLDSGYRAYAKLVTDAIHHAIENVPPSHTSPITEQIVRAASSPALHWSGKVRELTLFSDGLQTGATNGNGATFRLPSPDGSVLDGVKATYVEIGNKRDHRLQTHREREAWRHWLEAAGADARVIAPGYPATSS